jgi:hypothetical protein
MPANPLVEKSLKDFKTAINALQDREAQAALLEVHGKLTETYELRVESSDHAGSFGTLEADIATAEKAIAGADAAMFKKKMYGAFSLQELFDGWKATPVPMEVTRITKSKVRETLAAAQVAVKNSFESLLDYFNKDDDPSDVLAKRLGALGNSLLARQERLEERLRSIDALP